MKSQSHLVKVVYHAREQLILFSDARVVVGVLRLAAPLGLIGDCT